MWGTALGLLAQPLSQRLRRLARRGLLMALAFALAALAFLLGLCAVFAAIEPRVGPSLAAVILAGGLGVVSLVVALVASRPSRMRPPNPPDRAGGLAPRDSIHSWQLLVAAFAAGMAAGRRW